MIDVIDNKYFYLHNKEVAYLFDLLPNQQLEHLYYGEDLGKLSKNDLEYMSLHPNKASGTVKFSKKIKNLTLADRMQETPLKKQFTLCKPLYISILDCLYLFSTEKAQN